MGSVAAFDHTADVGLRITGTDLDDLFRTAAEGVMDYIVVNRDAVRATESEPVELTAETPADLLVVWLNEIVYRCETKHTLYGRFYVQVAPDARSLRAQIQGEPIDRERHELDHEVKAVTHHGLHLLQEPDGLWVAEVILDI